MDPPLRHLSTDEPLRIMRFQVSRGDYALCVADEACLAADPGPANEPQTGVSWHDATAYDRDAGRGRLDDETAMKPSPFLVAGLYPFAAGAMALNVYFAR